ncbi:MAG TPA: FkbM family methyltransferase [Mucilaginibacter sp.]|jgi:FkbM family methyltransferase|nr:FkbM family methyltransferase [Mucilaginibacter sp.]
MKSFIERLLIHILKRMRTDLLTHAHVQIGVGHNTYLSGEEYVIDTILEQVFKRDPQMIFDVGANVGDYTMMLRRHLRNAEINCFEPGQQAFNKLTANTAELNIKRHNTAVGSSNGTITLFKSSNDKNDAMMTAYKDTITDIFTFAGEPDEAVTCNLVTLDSFCKTNNIRSIDFLKIDVEGHEFEVLKGAAALITENLIGVIQFEFNEFNIVSKTFFFNYYKLLPQYKFYRVMPQNKLFPMGEYNSALEIFRYQNILAINNSLNYIYE